MKLSGVGAYGPFSYANPGQSLQTLNGLGNGTTTASMPAYSLIASVAPSVAAAIPASLLSPLATVGGIALTPFELIAYYLLYRMIR